MLIAMAVFDTVENRRTDMTRQTLESLSKRVNWKKHRLIISDNGSCDATQNLYMEYSRIFPFRVIMNGENLGTARAVNRAWSFRNLGEHLCKMDNDVVVDNDGWADEMEEVFAREPSIGICGLKRQDLMEHPNHEDEHSRTTLVMLNHKRLQTWIVVESANHIMGTCHAFSSALFDRIGYLFQGTWKYGFDDSLASERAHLAGFSTVFIPHIVIHHVDPGQSEYTDEKARMAGELMSSYHQIVSEYKTGERSVFFDGGTDALYSVSAITDKGDK